MLDIKIIKKILGIREKVNLSPEEMARDLSITFFPTGEADQKIQDFSQKLKKTFKDLGVNIIEYEDALVNLNIRQKFKLLFRIILFNTQILLTKIGFSFRDPHIKNLEFPFFINFGKKVRENTVLVSTGKYKSGNLAMDHTMSLKRNPIVSITERSKNINDHSSYNDHLDEGLDLFSSEMCNLAVTVSDRDWLIYSYNGSYPSYDLEENFRKNVLNSLIPKIAAPVRPPLLDNFIVHENKFDIGDEYYGDYINDLVVGGQLLSQTGLYPKRREISDLNFKNNFYRWIGSLILDKRNGMSYGFLARQLPVKLSEIIPIDKTKEFFGKDISGQMIIDFKNNFYIFLEILDQKFYLKIPDVWVLTSKSGSNKSNLNKNQDIIKMGLVHGEMIIETPQGVDISGDYKPSFDTRVILAHSLSNAIWASVIRYFKPDWSFPKQLSEKGMALVHWHGYINDAFVPDGWIVYGNDQPPVSCSSFQSAMYAFLEKQKVINNCLKNNLEFRGDIHIESHHGTNMSYGSIEELANFLLSDSNISKLG